MSIKISSKDQIDITLNESDEAASVVQSIATILSTRRQSIPLYREFGLPMQFIDRPIPVAKPMMVAEITEAIAAFEPRATLLGVTFEIDESAPGRLIPIVEVEINEQ